MEVGIGRGIMIRRETKGGKEGQDSIFTEHAVVMLGQ